MIECEIFFIHLYEMTVKVLTLHKEYININ